MPKVPQPDKTPESISPTLWQNVNRRDILSFLGDHSGSLPLLQGDEERPGPRQLQQSRSPTPPKSTRSSTCRRRSTSRKQIHVPGQEDQKPSQESSRAWRRRGDREAVCGQGGREHQLRQAPIRRLRPQGPPKGTLQPAEVHGPDQLLGHYQRRRPTAQTAAPSSSRC